MDFVSLLPSALGTLVIKANDDAVYFIGFDDGVSEDQPNNLTLEARSQLEAYLSGHEIKFDFPIKQAGTSFQQSVWSELMKIEAGKPISYAALSKRMKNPLAIRAIASANGKNKLMIVVPCHGVIGRSGELVGYAGGLWRKKWLLEHEAKLTSLGQTQMLL